MDVNEQLGALMIQSEKMRVVLEAIRAVVLAAGDSEEYQAAIMSISKILERTYLETKT